MKTFVRAKADYKDELEQSEEYEVVKIFETDETRSGVAVVINSKDALLIYDSNFFV